MGIYIYIYIGICVCGVYIYIYTYICMYVCIYTYICFPGDAVVKNPPVKRHRFNPLAGRSPGVGNGNPFQYSFLENFMDREAWWNTIHGVTKSQTQLSKHEHSLKTSSKLNNWLLGLPGWLSGKEYTCQCRSCRFDPWVVKIPWRGRNGNPLQYYCLENRRVRHDWACTHITPLSHLMKEKKICYAMLC